MQEIKPLTTYKLALRDRILDTVIRAFGERSAKALKMDDVAQTLGISKRTVYEIFATKEDVIFEAIKRYYRQRDEALSCYAHDPSHDVLDIVIFIYRNHMRDTGRIPPSFYDDIVMYPQIVAYLDEKKQRRQEGFMRFLQRGVDEGYFRKDIDYDLVSHIFEAIGRYLRENHLYERYSFEEVFHNMLFVTLRGFCTSKGIKKLDEFFAS